MRSNLKTIDDIIDTLEEIEGSLHNDIGLAVDAYMVYFKKTNIGVGLFAIPRLIFPEIDNLGTYYMGRITNTAENAIRFIKDYFSKVNPEYKKKGAFIYTIYRHGLMHQHVPKFMSYRRENIGWAISLSDKGARSNHLKMRGKTIQIDGRQFYEDLVDSIQIYKEDIKLNKNNLVYHFIKAHDEMMKTKSKTSLLGRSYLKQSDFDFLKR